MGRGTVAGRRGAGWAKGVASANFASPNPFGHLSQNTDLKSYDLMYVLILPAIYPPHAFGRRPHDI